MLKDIKSYFDRFLLPDESDSPDEHINEVHLAAAALLFELTKSEEDASKEWETARTILKNTFNLDDATLNQLVTTADSSIKETHDFYQFTQLINQHYSYDDKKLLIEDLWRLAYVDGRLDTYEEHFIRKIAGLFHLAHSDFINAKLRAKK